HACGRRRDGEPAVSWRTELRGREADLKQSVDRPSGEFARQHATEAACWLVAAANPQLQQECS
ncbi:MAG TPA: hypothetical protein VFU48_06015, partial [Nitrospira sp.]|nr:hypothetical protein [Nitrospira sp.]